MLCPFVAGLVTLLFFCGPQNEIWITLGRNEAYGVHRSSEAWLGSRYNFDEAIGGRRVCFQALRLLLLAGLVKESFIPVLPGVLAFVSYVALAVDGAVNRQTKVLRRRDSVSSHCGV